MKTFSNIDRSPSLRYTGTLAGWLAVNSAAQGAAPPAKEQKFQADGPSKKWLASRSTTSTDSTAAADSSLFKSTPATLPTVAAITAAATPARGDGAIGSLLAPIAPLGLAPSTPAPQTPTGTDSTPTGASAAPAGGSAVQALFADTTVAAPSGEASSAPTESAGTPAPTAKSSPSPFVTPAATSSVLEAPTDNGSDTPAADKLTLTSGSGGWNENWRSAASATPCGSCTGRFCTICSIRTGAPVGTNGQPTGYAPKVLEYYNPDDSVAGTDASQSTATLFKAAALTTESVSTLAATASNAIVLENQKQGTPESVWMIDEQDNSIEGFADQFSINHGGTQNFKINTDATNYRIDIYRLGYYGGDGARLVDSITKNLTTAQVQPDPLFDPTLKLVDAGNWSVSASWAIPGDAVSGVYVAELTRLDTGGRNEIPFVVRDDEAPSDITFQTSDTTWEAYNWWGGYNLYGGIEDGGHAGRSYAVSYNRPIITREGGISAGPQDYIYGAEYPTIRWLEQNGYDVNYISGIDTARDGAQLLNSNIFLSVGHDEYWSADQRDNVEAARDAGVNLAFLSGNEMYWETRWAPSIDAAGTPYTTMISYKEVWSNADIDPNGTTSTWRDAQLGSGEPENGLTGTIFTVDSYRLDTIQIPYDLSNFRFWSNTDVADLQQGQVYSLTKNLLGYEWDSDLDNGSRPDGLIQLSSTTLDVDTLLLDNGNTVGSGSATHSLTLYRAPSGALVFGAGSVYWTWGLDSHHDNEATPTDPNVQQAMVNLFADMGVQPETLMQSLAVASQTTDNVAPTSVVTSPTSSGSYTAGHPVTITGTATDGGGGLVAVVEVSTDNGASWHRATGYGNWTYNWTPLAGGTYTILSRAVDDSVNLETPGAGQTITVAPGATSTLFRSTDTPQILSDTDVGFVNLGVKFSASEAGTIVGIKFYKGLGDGGTHVGSLWTSTGQLLASATFTDESNSGWQTVTFTNPVSITAGTSYYASYTSNGHYANTLNYFTTTYSNGPLSAPATNGYYTYATGTAFPATASNGVNYWVDPIFSAINTTNAPPVGTNDNGYVATEDTPISFAAATLLANDSDPNGDALTVSGVGAASNGTVSFNATTNIITFTPNPGYTGGASFGYSISDGRGGVGSAIVNMTVVAPVSGASLFTSSDTPANLSDPDNVPLSLGTKFVASTSGTVAGVKFYKGTGDTGTHVGSLWTSTGTLLGSVTFTNETAGGWQTMAFANPISITAGTTYVVSYTSSGHYTSTSGYFSTDHVSGVLTAPASGNGVYTYGSGNLFPTSTYGATNYWVDVVFDAASGGNHVPVANNDSGFTTSQNTALTLAAAVLLANDTDADGNTLTITGVTGGQFGTPSFNAQTNTVTFTPNAGYTGAAAFNYTVSDGNGGVSSASVSLTVTAAANQPPVAVADAGPNTLQNTPLQIAASALLANDTDPNGDTLTVTGVSGASNGTVSFNASTNIITFTPTTSYTGTAGFTYAISDGRGGTASANVSLSVTAPATGTSLFAANATPATISENDASSVELGMKFTVAANGTITGIRFYKGPQNTGTHTGTLWSSTGTQLGTLTFGNETASGWQTASFATPISVSAGTTYTVSYHSSGHYSANANYFTAPVSNGGITAPVNAGVYAYGSTSSFPTNVYSAANYWVDVVYAQGAAAPNQAPVANADTGFTTVQNTATQIAASALLANDTDPNGDTLTVTGVSGASNGSVAFNASTNILTFTPTSGYAGAAGFSYAISDGKGGTASANVSLTVTAPATGVSLFAANATPANTSVNDPSPVELGMKFTASTAGTISGIRFYKGAQDTGIHTGTLWTSTGTKLGSVTFTNESASGWQSATLATPISITAGTTYVVSYHSSGNYAADSGYFNTTRTNGPLTAPTSASSGGNGVYAYGSTSLFPTNSYNSSNYWVDVIFNGQLAA